MGKGKKSNSKKWARDLDSTQQKMAKEPKTMNQVLNFTNNQIKTTMKYHYAFTYQKGQN